jgi:hypothetical protein
MSHRADDFCTANGPVTLCSQSDPQTALFGAFSEWAESNPGQPWAGSIQKAARQTRQCGSCLGIAADEVDLMPGSILSPAADGWMVLDG